MSERLHDYQVEGALFLARARMGVLADDAGLGKTAQAIYACVGTRAAPVLIICPASARINWAREWKRWGGRGEPTIVSYEGATQDARNRELCRTLWGAVILDEAHYLKNPEAKRTRAIVGPEGICRRTRAIYALTATWATNDASELWLLLHAFGYTKLGQRAFVDRFCQADRDGKVWGHREGNLAELRALLARAMIRRTKEEVLPQLPPITYGEVTVEPAAVDIDRWFPPREVGEMTVMDEVRAQEETLRSILANDEWDEDVSNMHLATLRKYTALAKVPAVADLLRTELESGLDKIVVFGWHVDALEWLHDELYNFGAALLTGSTTPGNRQEAIDRFQRDPKCRLFIGNLGAAGTAITLTAAANVLFLEASWVPGNNHQAAMRVHRLGQKRACLARFVSLAGSIDEQVQATLARKTRGLKQIFGEAV